MTVLPRRRSDCRLEAGRPVARARGVQGAVTAAGTGKKRGRRHSRNKAAPSPTTRVSAAAKRKEKASKARRSSQSNKARNQHNKQPIGTAASQSHSNSLPAVKPKAKNSGRASIANTSGRRGSASSSLPPPKPLARIPPSSPPLPRTSGRKTKSRNSQPQRKRQQRKLPPSGPAISTSAVLCRKRRRRRNTSKQPTANTPTSINGTAKKGAKVASTNYPPAHFDRSNQIPLETIGVANAFFHQDRHSTTEVNKSSRGYTKKSNGIARDSMVNSTVTTASKAPSNKSLKWGIGGRYHVSEPSRSSQPSSSQVNVNSRHTSTHRPPTICERYHITDPLNDYRFRINDYVPEFSVAQERDFQRRLAECHIFNMTQPDASVKKPRVNVKKQKKQKQKEKTEGGGTAGTPSKGKGKGKN
ncbi:hypothetical protein EYR40_001867 [Pleurotus pulmonarius]|nr:hypothetical protein EYR40_001867 [Pleurotus pulmonarius]